MEYSIIEPNNVSLFNYAESNDQNISDDFTNLFFELYVNPQINYQCFGYETDNVTINPGEVVVDCGGNMGLFAAWAASKGASAVFSYEPGHTAFKLLTQTSDLYNNIYCKNCAVGNKIGKQKFTECYCSCASHFQSLNVNENSFIRKEYNVFCTTLDKEFFPDIKIDFIKIDTEGAEVDIIKGARNILKKYSPKLAIACYHFNEEEKNLVDLILSINSNYKFEKRDDKLFGWIN